MPVEQDFRHRLNEVSLYLRSLKDVEKRQLDRNKMFYRASGALAASRAASFIMIYNCVEFAMKESLKEIRMEAAERVETFDELFVYWQHDLIKARFGAKLASGVNFEKFLIDLRTSMPMRPSWLKDERTVKDLPFSCNIDHLQLIDLARKLGDSRWKPPKSSLGGSDLELVRRTRNDLAHGDETFENIGNLYSIIDISEKLNRIRAFMCSYIRMLGRHRAATRYRAIN